MNKLYSVSLLLTLSICSPLNSATNNKWAKSPYFNTSFLRDYNLVEKTLINKEGFEKIIFKSSDGLKLKGLLLKQPEAIATIIFCAGFFPGRKEGQAPVYKMLPSKYNFLFFDARGHEKSEGPFFKTLGHYGRNEYKDIIGAIDFIQKNIGGKIIIYGVCSGSVHATHALLNLPKEKKSNIIGLVFDSGFGSTLDLVHALDYHIREKWIPVQLRWYANKEKIKKTFLYKICTFFATKIIINLNELLFMRKIRKYNPETKLSDKMHNINCPVLFIHCKNDKYSPFIEVKKLSETVKNCDCWWIEKSSHALHSIKYKYEYREKLISFFDSILI